MPIDRRPRRRRTWFQRFFLLVAFLMFCSSTVAAILLAYTSETVGRIPRTAYGTSLSAESESNSDPLNFLLIGSDSIANLPEGDYLRRVSGRSSRQLLTDTLIVLRLDPSGATKASALSLPRDLYVPISGYNEMQKINSIVYFTDKPTLVQTIRDVLDIPIHHVVEVDFNGFMRLFETIGGLDVYLEYPLRDKKAQLDIPESGCVTLTPLQALGLVRSRELQAYVENFDGWYGPSANAWVRVDGTGDFGRQERQQDFLILALQQAFDSGFRNPLKITEIIQEVLGGGFVNLDDRLTPQKAIDLAQQFRNFRPNDLEKYLLPTVYDFADELSIQRIVEVEAEPILDVFRIPSLIESEDLSLDNSFSEIHLENVELFTATSFGLLENSQEFFVGSVTGSQKMQTELTNAEKRAEILEKAAKIRGC
ncbi:MAG: LCP family protein [Actinomycetota bacterium]|nr:LCP family protein [Actinomycetota bacterium]MEC7117061.1 LCP family protein [Actinomycetota bacterium]MEC7367437.1 LCP family protein [Actinomycetota bacterium]MEC7578707.1 LCP family protein [Actinomycetota bacterium]MEC7608127.1 LCP family protein [Actinomycetota bacterium]